MGRSHLPSGLILLLSPIFLCHRIKDGGFIVAIRLTSFRPPKIRLHCRLPILAVLAMILGSKTSEMDFSTKTAQPRPQVLSVAVPFCDNCPVLSTSFSGYRKLLPNSVNASWL